MTVLLKVGTWTTIWTQREQYFSVHVSDSSPTPLEVCIFEHTQGELGHKRELWWVVLHSGLELMELWQVTLHVHNNPLLEVEYNEVARANHWKLEK